MSETEKNLLIVFRNKKLNAFDSENALISGFAEFGHWFDKISFVTFDNSEEIVRAIKEGKASYENTVIFCPQEMRLTLANFIGKQYSAEFDGFGVLASGTQNVFMLYSDTENRLTVKDVCGMLDKKYGETYEKAFIKTVGAPPEKINEAVSKAKSICRDADFNVCDRYGDCSIELIYKSSTPKSVFDSVNRVIIGTLNDYVYALENISLAERLVQLLKLRRMTICTAESFTGGGVGKRIVQVSGASEVYFEGLNTYANESKALRLGVSGLTLKQCGAVSEQTAAEMAEGLISGGNCDVSIATTGIAGPKSDNTLKPVGLAYIAVGLKDNVAVYKYNLKGSRENITETAINLALFLAFKAIK